MTTQDENKAIVTRFNKEFIEDGDIRAFHEIVDASFINHTAPAGVSSGPDGVSYFILEVLRKAIPDIRVHIIRQVAEDDLVITCKYFTGTHTGQFLDIAPSGRTVTLHVWDTIRLSNGRYTEHWSIRDFSELSHPRP